MDAVFTWVDGADPQHRAKRLAALREAKAELDPGGLETTRFHDSGELRLAIKLVRQNMPFIETIYLVTDEQVPAWLTEHKRRDLGVRLVDHSEIFRGYDHLLPTFNSRSIEAMLHRIPGLSETFAYFNDDFFVISGVSQRDYLDEDGRPKLRGVWRRSGLWARRVRKYWEKLRSVNPRACVRASRGLNGPRLRNKYGEGPHHFRMAHAPYVLRRGWFLDEYGDPSRLEAVAKHRFRALCQESPIQVVAQEAILRGRAVVSPYDWAYMSPSLGSGDARCVMWRLDSSAARARWPHLCVQSVEQFPEATQEDIWQFLRQLVSSD